MAVKVIFEYCETSQKWEVKVEGTTDKEEALQAFCAVVLTCHKADPKLLDRARINEDFVVSVAVH